MRTLNGLETINCLVATEQIILWVEKFYKCLEVADIEISSMCKERKANLMN